MKDILLVLIGAIISCGTTFFLDWIKCGREEKIYYKRKREETYIEMQDYITDLNAHWNEVKNKFLNNDLRLRNIDDLSFQLHAMEHIYLMYLTKYALLTIEVIL